MIRAIRDIAVGLWVYATTTAPEIPSAVSGLRQLRAERELREPKGAPAMAVKLARPPRVRPAPCTDCPHLDECVRDKCGACSDLEDWRTETAAAEAEANRPADRDYDAEAKERREWRDTEPGEQAAS